MSLFPHPQKANHEITVQHYKHCSIVCARYCSVVEKNWRVRGIMASKKIIIKESQVAVVRNSPT